MGCPFTGIATPRLPRLLARGPRPRVGCAYTNIYICMYIPPAIWATCDLEARRFVVYTYIPHKQFVRQANTVTCATHESEVRRPILICILFVLCKFVCPMWGRGWWVVGGGWSGRAYIDTLNPSTFILMLWCSITFATPGRNI